MNMEQRMARLEATLQKAGADSRMVRVESNDTYECALGAGLYIVVDSWKWENVYRGYVDTQDGTWQAEMYDPRGWILDAGSQGVRYELR